MDSNDLMALVFDLLSRSHGGHHLPASMRAVVEGMVPNEHPPSANNLWFLLNVLLYMEQRDRLKKVTHIIDDNWHLIEPLIREMSCSSAYWAFAITLQEQNAPAKAFRGVIDRLSDVFPNSDLETSHTRMSREFPAFEHEGTLSLQRLLDNAITQQKLWLSLITVDAISTVASDLNQYLTLYEVAQVCRCHRSADGGNSFRERLESQKASYHEGFVESISIEKKFATVTSKAGREHIVLKPDILFHDDDGEPVVSMENNLHGQRLLMEAGDLKGVSVIFDLAPNPHFITGINLKWPFKAVNVRIKLA